MNYRPNVALVLLDSDQRMLICERSDWRGSWQFPQGGIHKGETPEEALAREVREEIGLLPSHYRILRQAGPFRYDFLPEHRKGSYDGQEQIYFLAEMLPGAPPPNCGDGSGEFLRSLWIEPSRLDFDLVPPMKKDVYRRVLAEFF